MRRIAERIIPMLIALLTIGTAAAEDEALAVHADAMPEGGALELEDVLESVDRSYPLLLAALVDQERARAGVLEARGLYDTRLQAKGSAAPTGYYDRYSADLGIEQPTRLWGSRLFAGYRVGRGDYPSYLGGEKTNKGGELRAGVDIPLLKDGAVDADRTRLRTSEIKQRGVEPQIESQRIAIVRDATETFWDWVAMGLNVEVERKLLATARARGTQLEGRVEQGAIPRIQLIDNQRLIVDREIRLRSAERDALDAAIGLSLFFRDESGDTLIPGPARLPKDFPSERIWDEDQLLRDIALASKDHPTLRALRIRREELEARLALDRNALLPDLRLRLEGSQDMGESSAGIDSEGRFNKNPKDDTEVKAMMRFEIPVLQRGARGRIARTRAESTRLDYETRFARDQIEAEIRQAMAALRAAFDQTILARRNLELALELQKAEERKLDLGSSNLIDVNIRELQAADAARALIFAQAAFFRSVARYQAGVAAPPR